MAANRGVVTSGSGVTAEEFARDIDDEVGALWDRSSCLLTDVGGSENDITAACDPPFTILVAGMSFILKPVDTNTAAVTLSINGGTPISVKDSFGNTLTSGTMVADAIYHLVYDGTNYVVIGSSTLTKINDYQAFTSSGVWTKPLNCPDDAIVEVELWGGGGGGGDSGGGVRSCGGGGGSYVLARLRAGDLSSTETVTVGAGGAKAVANSTAGSTGGNSSFGAHAIAYGGGGGFGRGDSACGGGSGGATTAAGNPGIIGTSGGGASVGLGYGHSGGAGGDDTTAGGNSIDGGGGGGGTSLTNPTNGGSSFYGGGGGAARGNGVSGSAGTSVRGGNGGSVGANGVAPAGGGGAFANGARGEVRVWTRG